MAQQVATSDEDIFALRLNQSTDDPWGMTDRLCRTHPDYPKFRAALLKAMRAAGQTALRRSGNWT